MRHVLLSGVFTILVAQLSARGAVLEGPLVNLANGHTYFLLLPSSWTDAEAQANVLSGHLATIRNAQEQAFVFNNFGTFQNVDYSLWIGLHDPSHDLNGLPHAENFVWASGEASAYRNWAAGEPNNAHTVDPLGEDYVHMERTNNGFGIPPGFWNDMDNNGGYAQFAPFAGVAEVPGRPGDANLDGQVAFDDLLTLAQNYGLSHGATWAQGDFNGSGAINFNDLLLLAQNYGPSPATASPVPESVSAGLLLVAAPILRRRRRAQ